MTLQLTNPTRRLFLTLLAVFSMVVAALPTAFMTVADAYVPPAEEFEIDGNIPGDNDWAGQGGEQTPDPMNTQTDVSFTSSLTEADWPDWTVNQHKPNPDADLGRLFVNSQIDGADNTFLWVGSSRYQPSSANTQVTVEFNQIHTPMASVEASKTVSWAPARSSGDFKIRYNYPGNSTSDPDVYLASWTSGGSVWSGSWGAESLIAPPNSRSAVGAIASARDFAELEVDLGYLISEGLLECGQFGSASFRSEASGGNNDNNDPTMKDVAGPFPIDLNLCGGISARKVDVNGDPLAGATFELRDGQGAKVTGAGIGDNPCTTDSTGICSWSDLKPGDYTVVETSAPDGFKLSARVVETDDPESGPDGCYDDWATPEDVAGDPGATCALETLGQLDFVFENPRIPYRVLISWDSTNHVSTSHTFTVTLQQDLGSGWVAVPEANLTPTWTEGTATGSAIQSEDCSTTGTNSDGECSVTVYSDDEGTGSLFATFTAPYQTEVPVTFDSPTATKTWASYTITVGDDGVNLVDHPHTFTVELRRDTGSGPLPYTEQAVSLKWTDVDGSVTNDTCTTDTNGQCTYTVNSSVTGVGTLEASYSSTHDEGTVVYTTDPDATKRWVYYEVSVSDDSVNEVGTTHTFTVTLKRDWGDGNGPVNYGGQTLELDWAGPDGSTAPSECVTDSSGQCDVEVFSPITGTGLLTAHYSVALDSGEHTFDSPAAEKQWIDYAIEVTPEEADNLLGFDHEFTVTLTTDTGAGFGPAAGETVDLGWDGPDGSEADADTCVTDDAGQCTVTVSSPATGSGTLTASFGTEVDSGTISRSDAGIKTWVDYTIDVDPDRAVNPVGTTHTFTVTLERIDDGVASAAAEESVSLGIAGPGEIIEVPGGSIDVDGRNATCTTDAAGQCTVTIASNDVGDTTLAAMYEAEVAETSATFSDSGLKLWRSDPAIELVKVADIEPTAGGLKIITCNEDGCPETTFTFTVTNVGGVALHDVTLTDDKFGPITLQDDELEVGESTTGTANYTPSREEIDAGFHENLGTATGVSPDGRTVRDTDPERVEVLEVLPLTPIERPPAPVPAPEPAPEALPRTGMDVAWLTAEGLLAILLGFALVWVTRTRKREDQA